MNDLNKIIRLRRKIKIRRFKRKSVLGEYLQASSFHGLRYLMAPGQPKAESVTWALILFFAVVGTLYMSVKSWNRFQNDAVVNSIDRDFKNWQTPLPAILVCPLVKISEQKLDNYVSRFPDDEKDEIKRYLWMLSAFEYSTIPSNLMSPIRIESNNYMDILNTITFDLKFQERPGVDLVITEMGACHIFNSNISVFQAPDAFFNATLEVSYKNVELEAASPVSGDLISVILAINAPYNAMYVSPNDIPDLTAKKFSGIKSSYLMLEFKALSIIASENLRSLSINQRKCRFLGESDLPISRIYTYNLCRMNCRRNLALEFCKCAPHFYPIIDATKVCDLTGLRCIAKRKNVFLKLVDAETGVKIDCHCLPTCDDHVYYVDRAVSSKWFMGTNFKWSITRFSKWRIRRDVIFGFSEFLVSFGAIAGLFLGCSLLSFVEIFYYIAVFFITKFKIGKIHQHFASIIRTDQPADLGHWHNTQASRKLRK